MSGVDLDHPFLVLHVDDGIQHVEAESVRRTLRAWNALFLWDGDPTAIRKSVLEVGGTLAVRLGAKPEMRRRVGRTMVRPALALVAESPGAEGGEPKEDLLSVHAALVVAQDLLAVAREERDVAREGARRAREDAERERTRRQQEGARLHAALDELQRVGQAAVQAERERLRAQSAETERLQHVITAIRAETARLRDRVGAILAETARPSDRVAAIRAAPDDDA